ncbi:interleukin-13 receptor subunit alpha-1-like [Cheilinus undulatus]|uniref:interleukin-13 receptor subunit alpha-1-like n=1 Tax=Cheilinus undulatus TaxID=241271 RepID=UPI001BD3962E|nr:interleukin-13 receptor subunit alpha-1-like [Cheilinus undulatus]
MTFKVEFITFLACAAMPLLLHIKADCPPPPTRLKHEWLDPFTINVSWEKPSGLRDGREINYKYSQIRNGEYKSVAGTKLTHFTDICLTEEPDSDSWTYSVWTDGSQTCNSSNESTRVNKTFTNHKPRAKVVKDFKCIISGNESECSWIPVNPSLTLKLSYRLCGRFEERLKGLKKCTHFNSSGTRMGCRLKVDATENDICVLVETDAGMSTFKAALQIPSPPMSIREEENELILTWKHPGIGKDCEWKYEVCYKRCNKARECESYNINKERSIKMPYDESCRYEFQSSVKTGDNCKRISSDLSEVVIYDQKKLPDVTLTVVAIVIPIILSVCVFLSCYCFRRHSAIIFPNIPDPSAIFKEMMMNGNKEIKASGSLYTPVPEPIEPCRISPVTETSALQPSI